MTRISILALALFCISLSASAQKQVIQNDAGGSDDQAFHMGFMFQYVTSDFKIYKKPGWNTDTYYQDPNNPSQGTHNSPLTSMNSPVAAGFGLGFVTNFRMNENVDLRVTPGLTFADRKIDYTYQNTSENRQRLVNSTMANLPIGFKFKTDRQNNLRAYLLVGAKYAVDITSKKKTDDIDKGFTEKFLKNKSSFLSYEAAIGFDFYLPYFKMSPELKFTRSVGDILNHEYNPYSAPIDKLFLHNFQFSLFFE